MSGSGFISFAKSLTHLDDPEDWEDYSGRVESAVAALDLEIAFLAPTDQQDANGVTVTKCVMDPNDPDTMHPSTVLPRSARIPHCPSRPTPHRPAPPDGAAR